MSHVERMKEECEQLEVKCKALANFIYDNDLFKGLCKYEQSRMIMQLGFMNSYLGILNERIKAIH